MKRKLLFAFGVLPALYLAICVLGVVFEPRFVYRPSRTIRETPSEHGLVHEEVELRTSDGKTLHAWFFPRESARATVLFAHGTTGNVGTQLKRVRPMQDAGFQVLVFDYRGYGKSDGTWRDLDEEGTYRDADAAWRWLVETRGIAAESIVVWGRSLGGGVASWLALQHAPKALVLESTYTAAVDVGAEDYPWFPVRSIMRIRYPTNERLPSIVAPVFLAHARDDTRIPFAHAERNLASAKARATLVEMTGGHNAGISGNPDALAALVRFLGET